MPPKSVLPSAISRFAKGVLCCIAVVGTAAAKPVGDVVASRMDQACARVQRDAQAFREMATCEAKRLGLPPELATAVMEIESGFNSDARGAAGEVGLMQVMPPTARMLGFGGDDEKLAEPAANIKLGVRYLARAHKLAGGDLCTTVMKYRAGHSETRFSPRSVAYCIRARTILSRDGYDVTGEVPSANLLVPAPKRATLQGQQVKASLRSTSCTRRILVPGPRYMQCADHPRVRVLRYGEE